MTREDKELYEGLVAEGKITQEAADEELHKLVEEGGGFDPDDPKEQWRFERFVADTVEEAQAEFKRRGILR